jgi:hypothetical protein
VFTDSAQPALFSGAGDAALSCLDSKWGVVDVAFNLHKGDLSFRATTGERRGRVIHYCNLVLLRDAKFRVLKAGYEKAIKTQCRNIHAFVRGEVIEDLSVVEYCQNWTRVHYNPFVAASFTQDGSYEPIEQAKFVLLLNQQMYAIK